MSAIEIDNLLDVLQVKENAITTSDDTTEIIKILSAIKSSNTQILRSYASISNLPTASATNKGNVYYIENVNKLYVSTGTNWQEISVTSGTYSISGSTLTGSTQNINFNSYDLYYSDLGGQDTTYTFSNPSAYTNKQLIIKNTTTTPFRLSNPANSSEYTLNTSTQGIAHELWCSDDGMNVYINATNGGPFNRSQIAQFSLASAFDISSLTYVAKTASINSLSRFQWIDNGNKIAWDTGSTLFVYSASTPYAISTVDTTSALQTVSGSYYYGWRFSSDGTKYIKMPNLNSIELYSLSTAYDMSTISSSAISSTLINPTTGITYNDPNVYSYHCLHYVSPDGKTVIVTADSYGAHQFIFDTGWDLTTLNATKSLTELQIGGHAPWSPWFSPDGSVCIFGKNPSSGGNYIGKITSGGESMYTFPNTVKQNDPTKNLVNYNKQSLLEIMTADNGTTYFVTDKVQNR